MELMRSRSVVVIDIIFTVLQCYFEEMPLRFRSCLLQIGRRLHQTLTLHTSAVWPHTFISILSTLAVLFTVTYLLITASVVAGMVLNCCIIRIYSSCEKCLGMGRNRADR